MYKLIIFTLLSIFVLACDNDKPICVEILNSDCLCPYIYNPVCGCNDVTYSNNCDAECRGIEVVSNVACIYDNKPLEGKWNFLGYISEGAKFKLDNKVHEFEMFILLESEKSEKHIEYYKMSGKSSVNFIIGEYGIVNRGKLYTNVNLTTKIAGTGKDLDYESRYIDNINNTIEYKIEGNFMEITSKAISTLDPLKNSIVESMIFVKN